MMRRATQKNICRVLRPFWEAGLIPQEVWDGLQEKVSESSSVPIRPDLRTKREVAEMLRVTTRSINNLMREGVLPYIKPTGKRAVRFRMEDVQKLLE